MKTTLCFLALVGAVLGAASVGACGGNVVAEPGTSEGAGASGGQSSSTANNGAGATAQSASAGPAGTTGPTGAGGSGDCAPLEAAFQQAFAQAIACDPCIDFDGCMNGPTLYDACGCPAGGNAGNPAATDAATKAYAAWTAAGCGPYGCGKRCPGPGVAWACTPTGRGCVGTCQAAVF